MRLLKKTLIVVMAFLVLSACVSQPAGFPACTVDSEEFELSEYSIESGEAEFIVFNASGSHVVRVSVNGRGDFKNCIPKILPADLFEDFTYLSITGIFVPESGPFSGQLDLVLEKENGEKAKATISCSGVIEES